MEEVLNDEEFQDLVKFVKDFDPIFAESLIDNCINYEDYDN